MVRSMKKQFKTAVEIAKDHGLKNLKPVIEQTGISYQNLQNWSENPKKHKLLGAVIRGCVPCQTEQLLNDIGECTSFLEVYKVITRFKKDPRS